MPSSRKTTRSIRLDQEIDNAMRRLADGQHVSVNFLVGKAVRRFVEWDAYSEKFGFITVPLGLLAQMMTYLGEDDARELGRWAGRDLIPEYVTFWFKEVTLESVLEAYPTLLAKYGNVFELEETTENGRRTFILKHGCGRKWSAFHEEVIRTLFGDLLKRPVQVEALENQVMASFLVP